MNTILDENLTTLAKKKVGWIMEIMEMSDAPQDAKIRVKKAVWNLLDEIKESINQVKELNENSNNRT
tara:strand:+ start:300 stop:500 length:201 start_codon:yes stop_codon:yes gene_type:complete